MGLIDGWRVSSMTPAHAAALMTWAYEPPYDRYSMTAEGPAGFLEPANGFVAIVDGTGRLTACRSFGIDGRVPGGSYDDTVLDTGGAMRPDLTGRGLGAHVMRLGLDYGVAASRPRAFRVTVWPGNQRALKVAASLGFAATGTFVGSIDRRDYTDLTRNLPACGKGLIGRWRILSSRCPPPPDTRTGPHVSPRSAPD